MSGHRQAAIALHGVSSNDQEAILANLPEQDQTILRGYLQELQTLGFTPTDNALAVAQASLPSAATEPTMASAVPAAPEQPMQLADVSAACMFAVLAQEPSGLIAQVLSISNWPWAAEMLTMFAPAKRAAIVNQIDSGHNLAQKRQQLLAEECLQAAKRVARTVAAEEQSKRKASSTQLPASRQVASTPFGRGVAAITNKVASWFR